VLAAAACAFVVAHLGADVSPTPDWTISNGISRAVIRGDTIYVGGAFAQLYSPSTSQDQFYDFVTGQVRADCARSTSLQRPLSGYPDNQGGLLVPVVIGDSFADVNGVFTPPDGTTLARIADTCRWDRQFAAPAIDPHVPTDLTIGVPARAGNIVVTTNAVIGPDLISLQARGSGVRCLYRRAPRVSVLSGPLGGGRARRQGLKNHRARADVRSRRLHPRRVEPVHARADRDVGGARG
jgi:hypothetical protein